MRRAWLVMSSEGGNSVPKKYKLAKTQLDGAGIALPEDTVIKVVEEGGTVAQRAGSASRPGSRSRLIISTNPPQAMRASRKENQGNSNAAPITERKNPGLPRR
jgi:hypothetical protein